MVLNSGKVKSGLLPRHKKLCYVAELCKSLGLIVRNTNLLSDKTSFVFWGFFCLEFNFKPFFIKRMLTLNSLLCLMKKVF